MSHQPITSDHAEIHGGLLSRGMVAVLIAQFISALTAIAGCYLLAAAANLLIPRLKPMHPLAQFAVVPLLKDFIHALKTLFKNKDARFSLVGTSVFWGAGSTLRFLLVAWVPVALNIHDLSTPANLSGAVAIGIAFGAFAAAKYVNLGNVNRALPAGILIGLLIMTFAYVTNLYVAIALLIVVGACGGFYVVPLNALLQERGHETVGAGHAIAIQNLVENFLMLLMIGFYTLLDKQGTPVVASTVAVGALVFVAISTLAWTRLRHSK